mgnify:CR=1 FL=1
MHYKHKRTAKEKSTSFYLSVDLLKKLDFVAELEGQSRSVIVEACVEFYLKGKWNDETEFCRVKRKLYKKQRPAQRAKRRKTKKNIQFSQENEQSLFVPCEWTKEQTAFKSDLQGV